MPGWQKLCSEADKKLSSNEDAITRLIFRTRTEVDPIELEYFRGFRQGVKYVLDGLPNTIKKEFQQELDKQKERRV